MRRSIQRSNDQQASSSQANPEIDDFDYTIQTRKRKRSLIYSRNGINEIVILSSRNENPITTLKTPISDQVFSNKALSTSMNSTSQIELKSLKSKVFSCFNGIYTKFKDFFLGISKWLKKVKTESQASFTKVLMAKEDLREIDLSMQKSRFVLLPTSFFQRNWDLLMLLWIFYDFYLFH